MATLLDVVVLDASLVVDLLMTGVNRLPSGAAFAAPAHIDAEVMSALARLARAGTLSSLAVEDMLEGLVELPFDRVALGGLVAEAFALRGNVAIRESLYVALAAHLVAPLLTLDRKLAATCRQTGACLIL